jgi:hypothetical protein
MSNTIHNSYHTPQSLRFWPALVIVFLQWFLRWVLPAIYPEGLLVAMVGSLACGPLLLIWWLFFSRVRWSERIGGMLLVIGIMWLVSMFLHESIGTSMMGMMYGMFAIPTVCLAFVLWVTFIRSKSLEPRWASMALAIFVG